MRWFAVLFVVGCATPMERQALEGWSRRNAPVARHDGTLARYQALASEGHPDVLRRLAQWEAAHERVALGRRMPDPRGSLSTMTGGDGVMLTQAGVSQQVPWTAKLSDRADANAWVSNAAGVRVEATRATLSLAVAEAYWALWHVRATRAIQTEHVTLLAALAETVRARVSAGSATLSELQQVELRSARTRDGIDALTQNERALEARLRGLVPGLTDVATPDDPKIHRLMPETIDALVASHPDVVAAHHMSRAQQASADAEERAGMPDFSFDVAWRFQEEAMMVGAGLTLPIWRLDYERGADALRAESVASTHEAHARELALRAQAEVWKSVLDDSARRVALVNTTLLPQAQAAYESVLGAYAVGKAGVASVLLAQQDLLELAKDQVDARARHETAFAQIAYALGDISTQDTP